MEAMGRSAGAVGRPVGRSAGRSAGTQEQTPRRFFTHRLYKEWIEPIQPTLRVGWIVQAFSNHKFGHNWHVIHIGGNTAKVLPILTLIISFEIPIYHTS